MFYHVKAILEDEIRPTTVLGHSRIHISYRLGVQNCCFTVRPAVAQQYLRIELCSGPKEEMDIGAKHREVSLVLPRIGRRPCTRCIYEAQGEWRLKPGM